METFSVGEVCDAKGRALGEGWHECVITQGLHETREGLRYSISVAGKHSGTFNGEWCAGPEHLRKRKPPREDLTVTKWDECPWQPETADTFWYDTAKALMGPR